MSGKKERERAGGGKRERKRNLKVAVVSGQQLGASGNCTEFSFLS